ncbi:MAG: ACT domain-containing protein, partial [Acidimicrobiales bacterium]
VRRPDLLVVAALLHDIGKGFPGDHTAAGVTIVGEIGCRMGFSDDEVDVLVSLVRNHVLLAETATRRDLDDPGTVDGVLRSVGDSDRLELLAALTQADSLATGPAAWGPWKAGLVADLVQRTAARMAGEEPPVPSSIVTDRHRAFMRQAKQLGRSVVLASGRDVTVVSRNRPGLLAAVTGVFALRGLDVRSADVTGEGNYAVELFVVEPARQRWPDWKLVADQIDAVMRGTLPIEERLRAQARAYAGGQRASSSRPVSTSVTIDNTASVTSTVIEIRAPDALGLLHRVTNALFASDLDVVTARVSTFGDSVVDAFYVREATGGKVTGQERMERIRQNAGAAATPDVANR